MPIEIPGIEANIILRINQLINAYRAGLTTGMMNARGGFEVHPELLALGNGIPPFIADGIELRVRGFSL